MATLALPLKLSIRALAMRETPRLKPGLDTVGKLRQAKPGEVRERVFEVIRKN
jgi:hypothetical protein